MQPCAERSGVEQSERAGLRFGVSRNNPETSDGNGVWGEDPNRSRVATRCRRYGDIVDVDAERARDLFRRDAVGHQRRDPAAVRFPGVNRAQFDEPVERIVDAIAEVHTVRHAPAYRVTRCAPQESSSGTCRALKAAARTFCLP